MRNKLFIICLVFLLIFCSSCKKDISNHFLSFRSQKECSFTTFSEILSIETNQNSVKIVYPSLSNSTYDCSNINSLIQHSLYAYLEKMYGLDFSNLSLLAEYNIMLLNNYYISIVFYGISNNSTAAYPINFSFSVNIQLDESKIIKLSDIIKIDDNFINEFKESFVEQTNNDIAKYIQNYTDEELKSFFEENTFSYYFTDEEIGIIFEIPHAIGDYIEIKVRL